ncbi:hypothetical protein WJX75_003813 [Coccomyxa subellipsoidea]|uniref:DNA-directed RNA polymerase III subunit RPC9 n=1 Tax=Coccomyxa subellipsoidea TaxID=248742 RepID=A0ABR2YBF7_9CHLO
MIIVEENIGPITDVEVLKVLERRGANQEWSRKKTLPSERKAYSYLLQKHPHSPTREELQAFFDDLKPFNLSRGEILQIANSRPAVLVEIHLIVDDCEQRLSPEQQDELLALVQKHLPLKAP